jgi:hypothetical protein
MAAVVQTNASNLASLKVVPTPGRPQRVASHASNGEPRPFPEAPARPALPPIPDEILDLYAFIFCQGGFRRLGMTFEQFLLVAAVVKAPDLPDACDGALSLSPRSIR